MDNVNNIDNANNNNVGNIIIILNIWKGGSETACKSDRMSVKHTFESEADFFRLDVYLGSIDHVAEGRADLYTPTKNTAYSISETTIFSCQFSLWQFYYWPFSEM